MGVAKGASCCRNLLYIVEGGEDFLVHIRVTEGAFNALTSKHFGCVF